MINQTQMDEKVRLRQFWLRCLFALGLFWGLIPLITLPFITRGAGDSTLDVLAAVSNGLTLLPASILGFWHRRVACVWLTANASIVAASVVAYILRNHEYRVGNMIGASVSVLLALILDMTEARRWPPALGQDR